MDVRCNRCATEYEFDDALISERGTTVKCTNCGLQFKIFPLAAQASPPERWVVRKGTGAEMVFTSLRELQRGIAERYVGPDDWLSRGGLPARPLGSIAELEPFFTSRSTPPPDARPVRTLHGFAAGAGDSRAPSAAEASVPPERSRTPRPAAESSPQVLAPEANRGAPAQNGTLPSQNPVFIESSPNAGLPIASLTAPSAGGSPRNGATEESKPASRRGSTPLSVATPATLRAGSSPRIGGILTPSPARAALGSSPTSVRGSSPELRSSPGGAAFALRGSSPELRSSPGSGPLSSRGSSPELRSSPGSSAFGRRDLRSYDALPSDELAEGGRRARSRWIAAIVVLGVATLFAVTVGRRYLLETAGPAAQTSTTSAARVEELLREGTRLTEEGDLDAASEPLLRATGLAERDRRVLAAIARLETLRADATWLRLRLLDPQVTELVQATHRELGRRVGKARSATDAAFAVGPEDLVVLRARVDTLRLSGEADKAREWLGPIASAPADPNNAYVLAALDLAGENPPWPSVIERLRVAANGERVPGRAHAALVYALVRGGRLPEAEIELGQLDASPNAALLIDELKSFLKRYLGRGPNAAAAVDPRKLGKLDTGTAEDPRAMAPHPAAAEESRTAGGFRKLLSDATNAVHKGDLSRAQDLYLKVLSDQPGNTEALAGLADIARRQNKPNEAARLYDRVLESNPSYLPALLARAEQQWESGNKKAAVALYKRVLDQAGADSEYGSQAAARIAQVSEHPQLLETDAPSQSAPSGSPPTPSAPAVPEGVDTTDLPGFK